MGITFLLGPRITNMSLAKLLIMGDLGVSHQIDSVYSINSQNIKKLKNFNFFHRFNIFNSIINHLIIDHALSNWIPDYDMNVMSGMFKTQPGPPTCLSLFPV